MQIELDHGSYYYIDQSMRDRLTHAAACLLQYHGIHSCQTDSDTLLFESDSDCLFASIILSKEYTIRVIS